MNIDELLDNLEYESQNPTPKVIGILNKLSENSDEFTVFSIEKAYKIVEKIREKLQQKALEITSPSRSNRKQKRKKFLEPYKNAIENFWNATTEIKKEYDKYALEIEAKQRKEIKENEKRQLKQRAQSFKRQFYDTDFIFSYASHPKAIQRAFEYFAKKPEIMSFINDNLKELSENVRDYIEYRIKISGLRKDNTYREVHGGYSVGYKFISNRSAAAREMDFHPATDAAKKAGVPAKFIKDVFEPSSWHHTGYQKYGVKETNHYDLVTIVAVLATPAGQSIYLNWRAENLGEIHF